MTFTCLGRSFLEFLGSSSERVQNIATKNGSSWAIVSSRWVKRPNFGYEGTAAGTASHGMPEGPLLIAGQEVPLKAIVARSLTYQLSSESPEIRNAAGRRAPNPVATRSRHGHLTGEARKPSLGAAGSATCANFKNGRGAHSKRSKRC